MYFKWTTCLLLRQFTVKIGLRMFDTYIADENNYFNFISYEELKKCCYIEGDISKFNDVKKKQALADAGFTWDYPHITNALTALIQE